MENDRLDYYISIGAVEVSGIDESGEFIYGITDKAKDLAPELWEKHREHVDGALIDLFNKGLINISYTEDLEAVFEMTDEGHKLAKEYGLIQIDPDDIPNN